MSDEVVLKRSVEIPKSSTNVTETSPKFESTLLTMANQILEDEGIDPSSYRLADIDIDEDSYIVRMAASVVSEETLDGSCHCENHDDRVEDHRYESSNEDLSSIEDPSQVKPSAAYDGPWEEKKFEMDIVQLCALMDIINFTMVVAKPPPEGPGMITETLPRSLAVLNNFCIKNVCIVDEDEIRKAVESGKQIQISPDPSFDDHFTKWMKESTDLFEKQRVSKKIVQAKMMPGAGFDPKGGPGVGLR